MTTENVNLNKLYEEAEQLITLSERAEVIVKSSTITPYVSAFNNAMLATKKDIGDNAVRLAKGAARDPMAAIIAVAADAAINFAREMRDTARNNRAVREAKEQLLEIYKILHVKQGLIIEMQAQKIANMREIAEKLEKDAQDYSKQNDANEKEIARLEQLVAEHLEETSLLLDIGNFRNIIES